MNGTISFGVCVIGAALFFQGAGLVPLLIAGVVIIAYGAFAPPKLSRSNAPRRLPSDSDPWV